MPPWLRLLPRPNADCLFRPSVNSILRRTSIRWRGQRRDCSADPDWFISAIPFAFALPDSPTPKSRRGRGRGGGELTFSQRNPCHREILADLQFANVRRRNPAFSPSLRSRSSTYRSQVEIDA